MTSITNLNVRLLADGSVFYSYEREGKRVDGSERDWEAFAGLLGALVGR